MKKSTLHLYNSQNIIELDSYLKLINQGDWIVVINDGSSQQLEVLINLIPTQSVNISIIKKKSDYKILLDLLKEYKKVMTWK